MIALSVRLEAAANNLAPLVPLARLVLQSVFSVARHILAISVFIARHIPAIVSSCLRIAKEAVELACCVFGFVIEFIADAHVLLVQVVQEVAIAIFTAMVTFLAIEGLRQSALLAYTAQDMSAGPSLKLWNFTLGRTFDPRLLPLAPASESPMLDSLPNLGRLSFSDMCFIYFILFLVMVPIWWPGCLIRAREACFRAREARRLAQKFLFVPAAEEAPPNSRANPTVFTSSREQHPLSFEESARRSKESPFRCGEPSHRSNFSASPLRSKVYPLRPRESPLRFQKPVPVRDEAKPRASKAESTSPASQPTSSPTNTVLVTSEEVYSAVCQSASFI
ncbi:hypothetical protein MD484_g5064, partial [Candolleomyces efflorescens]